MRILQVAESFATGVLEVVRQVSAHAAEAGHTVAVAYGRRAETPTDVAQLMHPSVELIAMPWTRRTPVHQLRAAHALREVIGRWNPDVVHLHSSFAGLIGSVAVPSGTPSIYSPHAFASSMADLPKLRRRAYLTMERLASRRADLLGAVSLSEGDYARRVVGAPAVAVVPNGIAELNQCDPPRDGPPEIPCVCGMGRIGPQRRPDESAEILRAVSDIADVVWLGDEDRPGRGAQRLRAAGVGVTGWLSRDALLRRLSEATIYLHWTAWDGHPLAILEALAKDVVVVASDIPSSREILGDAQVCRTAADATWLIRRLLETPRVWQEAVERQSRVRTDYSARRMSAQWLKEYDTLATKTGRRTVSDSRSMVRKNSR